MVGLRSIIIENVIKGRNKSRRITKFTKKKFWKKINKI